MRFTITIRTENLEDARKLCFSSPNVEGACFLLCGESRTEEEVRLLVQQVLPIDDASYLVREPDFLSLDSPCYVSAAKQARDQGLSIVFVHSHPGGLLEFSAQDDREEPKLQEFFTARVPGRAHAALVLTETGVIGRAWHDGFVPLERIRVIGSRFDFHFGKERQQVVPEFFERQVRAFGPDIQSVLSQLHIGVVGAGGTGSACVEELARLGVGTISIFDEDHFEASNVNRVYGSSTSDEGRSKAEIAGQNVDHIAVGTKVKVYPIHITHKRAALELRECDLVFGCTDKEAPRAILTQLSIRYLIPLIDMGVLVNSDNGRIREVVGRITTFFPGEACLFCRGRISPERVSFEMLGQEEQALRIKEGYAPELLTRSPAVIPFTTAVAAFAITDLLQRLTGFMGNDRKSTETLIFFDKGRMNSNREPFRSHCFCSNSRLWGKGDSERFLDLWG